MFDIPKSRTGFYANECPSLVLFLLAGLLLYIRHLSKKDNYYHLDILYTLLVYHYCYIPGTNYLRKHILGCFASTLVSPHEFTTIPNQIETVGES